MDLDEKNKVWEEINKLTHIGRSGHDIEQALIAKGYDKALLDEILTNTFMKRLVDKEEMFLHRKRSADDRAAERDEKAEEEALKQKNLQQDIKKQNELEELVRQDEEHKKDVEDEKNLTEGQGTGGYLMNPDKGQDQARQLAQRE